MTDRTNGDQANATAIAQEASDRAAAITQEQTDRATAVQTNADAIAKEISDRTAAVQAEADARVSGIQQEASDRADAISAEATARGAAITTETNARQAADSSLSTRIDTNTAAVGANTAAIQTEQTARVAGDSSEANQRETLATQMRGDYTGNDLSQVSTGLIASERSARTSQYESIAQQMTLLSAGVGEQFDYAQIWYFTNDAEGWAAGGGTIGWSGSWIYRPFDNSSSYLVSPRGLNVNGSEYTQARLRVRKVGAPTWRGLFGIYAPGQTGPTYTNLNFAEPAWDENGIGVVMVDTGYTGVIDGFICLLENGAATADNHYEIDWVTVGRPAPGASSAALANEGTARAAADIAEATARQTLSVKMVGQADPTNVTLDNVASGLIADEKNARVSADGSQVSRISTMEARMPTGTGALATSASVSDEASARTTADTALSTRTSAVEARLPAGTDQLATAASVASEASARTDADGALSTRIDAVTATANNAATQAALTAEQTARATADAANVTAITALKAAKGAVFQDLFTDLNQWSTFTASQAEIASAPSTESINGGSTTLVGNNAGNDSWWGTAAPIALDPSKLYKLRLRVRVNAGTGLIYAGVRALKADGVTAASNNYGNQYLLANAAVPAAFTEYTCFVKGVNATTSAGGAGTLTLPFTLPVDTRYIAPLMLLNYSNTTGITEVDYFVVEDADALGQALTAQAQVTAETTARTTADTALGQRIDTVDAAVGGNTAAINAEQTARADGDSANAATSAALQASLNTTNTNVTAAQTTASNAANAAASAAGIANSKGKVLIQSSAPATADQLTQNLWIDTTGNANTPKKWNGSAWVAVTDKAATDAAAAAVAAQNTANAAQQAASTNATAINSTNATVTQHGTAITANTTAITGLQASVGDNTSAITAEQQARATGDAANASATTALASSFGASKTDAGSLLPDYPMADPTAWTSHYGANIDLSPNFITVTDGQISNTVAHHATGTFWNYSKTKLPMVAGETYRISAWFRASSDSNGNNYLTRRYYKADGSDATDTAGNNYGSNTVAVPKTSTWTLLAITINANDMLAFGAAFVQFGFAANHISTAGWAECQGVRVVKVIKSTDTDASVATTASVTNEATTRASADSALSTQLNIVQATANAAATGAQLTQEATTRAAADTAMGSDIALLGAHNAGKTAFVLNQDTVQVDGSTSFAQMLTGINATAAANTSAASAAQTTATNAATAAASAAGIANGKADVLIQSTAPAVAMQKATTLWIDTTNNANTPKRWSGSAWAVVTDKAATDAASAAAAAQATATAAQTAATQAQANINTEATTRADADTALGQRIDTVNAAVGGNTAAINAEQTARADGDSANASAITAVQAGMVASGENLFPDTDSTLNGVGFWNRNNAGMPAIASAVDTYGHYVRMLTGGLSGAIGAFTKPGAYTWSASPGPYAFGIDIWNAGAPVGSTVVSMDFYGTSGYLSSIVAVDNNPSATYHRITATGVAPAGTTYYLMSVSVSDGSQVAEVDFKRIKVERGTVATAYSPDTTSIANASAVQQLTAGTTIGGSAYAAATVMVDANGHIGGTRLASDGTTSSFVVVADQFGVVSPTGTG